MILETSVGQPTRTCSDVTQRVSAFVAKLLCVHGYRQRMIQQATAIPTEECGHLGFALLPVGHHQPTTRVGPWGLRCRQRTHSVRTTSTSAISISG